jgi:hypothetical protein
MSIFCRPGGERKNTPDVERKREPSLLHFCMRKIRADYSGV